MKKHRILHDALGRAWIVPSEKWDELSKKAEETVEGAREIESLGYTYLNSPTDFEFGEYSLV